MGEIGRINNERVKAARAKGEDIAAYNRWAGAHESIVAKSLLCAGTTWAGVYLAEDQLNGTPVAVKVLEDPYRDDQIGRAHV